MKPQTLSSGELYWRASYGQLKERVYEIMSHFELNLLKLLNLVDTAYGESGIPNYSTYRNPPHRKRFNELGNTNEITKGLEQTTRHAQNNIIPTYYNYIWKVWNSQEPGHAEDFLRCPMQKEWSNKEHI